MGDSIDGDLHCLATFGRSRRFEGSCARNRIDSPGTFFFTTAIVSRLLSRNHGANAQTRAALAAMSCFGC
jgi:hypothetical protein